MDGIIDSLQEPLQATFLGNSIWQILLYLLVLLGAGLAARTLNWFIKRFIRRWVSRTKIEFDDVLLDVLSRPLVVLASLIIAYLGLDLLVLSEEIRAGVATAFSVAVTLVVTFTLANVYEKLLDHWLTPLAAKSNTRLDDQLYPILIRGGKYTIIALGFIIALSNAGYNIYSLLAGLGVGGIALAMAARETIAHAFGGITIFTDRPFQIGDYVILDGERGFEGVIENIGLRSTRIHTRFDTMLVVPNALITNQPIVNVSSYNNRRRNSASLTLALSNSHEKTMRALALIKEILDAHEDVDKSKVYFEKYTRLGMRIKYRFWVSNFKRYYQATSEVNSEILKRFEADDIALSALPLVADLSGDRRAPSDSAGD